MSYLYIFYFVFFFFSSRRRHTRSLRDWSSDVCSSDLTARPLPSPWAQSSTSMLRSPPEVKVRSPAPVMTIRSEERRVGKECGGRWGQCVDKKIVWSVIVGEVSA